MTQHIPKIVHYIWIGNSPMPDLVMRCIESFKKHLPDYELVLWDNERSEVVFEKYPFARQAFQAGLYAFASDVIRLHALYEHGGIYIDSDVELFKSLDPFLGHKFFSGFQDPRHAITAIMGSEKNGSLVATLLNDYEKRNFLNKDNEPDLTTNTRKINQHLVDMGIVLNDQDQVVGDNVAIYRREIFCPFHPKHGGEPTENTVAMHHFNASWVEHRKHLKEKQRVNRRQRRSRIILTTAIAVFACGLAYLALGT